MTDLASLLMERRALRQRVEELDVLIREARAGRRSTRRSPLTRPDGTDPVGFSRRVAEAYKALLLVTHAPAPILATEAGVPVTTVHRWIVDARKRGLLPPTTRGKLAPPGV